MPVEVHVSGKKGNKIPRRDEFFDQAPAPDSVDDVMHDDDDEPMRVSVSWAEVGATADAVLGASGGVDPVVTEQHTASPRRGTHDLDDVPVTGAPDKTFQSLLEESLLQEADPENATPTRGTNTTPKTTESAPLRPFLRRGARSQRVAVTGSPSESNVSLSETKPRVDSHRVAKAPDSGKPATRARGGSYASAYLHEERDSKFGYDETETTRGGKTSTLGKHTPSKAVTAMDELAEFEALELELLLDSTSRAKSTSTRAGEGKASGMAPTVRHSQSMSRAESERVKLAAAMKNVNVNRLSDVSDNDGRFSDDGDAIGTRFSGKNSPKKIELEPKKKAPPLSPAASAFDDDESWDDDGVYGHFGDQRTSARKVAALSPQKPGAGAPPLIKSLFYGTSSDAAGKSKDTGKNRTSAPTTRAIGVTNATVSAARSALDAAAAQEAAAAARDASESVRRERERLEKDKVVFAKERRLFQKERQHEETQLQLLHADLDTKQHALDVGADKVKRDRQRLERESRRAAEIAPTKAERVELEDLRREIGRLTEEAKTSGAKHKASADRLRRQVTDLRDEVNELKGEKKRLEMTLLRGQDDGGGKSKKEKGTADERETRERELREQRELRERRDRAEMETLAREQQTRRHVEEQRERELRNASVSLRGDAENETGDDDRESDASDDDAGREDTINSRMTSQNESDTRLGRSSRGLGAGVSQRTTPTTHPEVVGVTVLEAAAAHELPSVRGKYCISQIPPTV